MIVCYCQVLQKAGMCFPTGNIPVCNSSWRMPANVEQKGVWMCHEAILRIGGQIHGVTFSFGWEFLNYELAISIRKAGHEKHLVVLETRNKKCPRRQQWEKLLLLATSCQLNKFAFGFQLRKLHSGEWKWLKYNLSILHLILTHFLSSLKQPTLPGHSKICVWCQVNFIRYIVKAEFANSSPKASYEKVHKWPEYLIGV